MNGSFGNVVVRGDCAVKTLQTADCFPYFVREAAALKMLGNRVPGVIPLRYIVGDTLHLQRYTRDLQSALDRGDVFSPLDVYYIAQVLLDALCALDSYGISHRDVKLANILYNESTGDVVLCDFGLARYHNGQAPEQITDTVQTHFYRSPELLHGTEGYDVHNLDIWSLGICLLELLRLDVLLPVNDSQAEYIRLYGANTFPTNDRIFWKMGINMEFMSIIKDMLTYNYKIRPAPLALRNRPFFGEPLQLTNLRERRERVLMCNLDNCKPLPCNEFNIEDFQESLQYFQFNNKESISLAQTLITLLASKIRLHDDDIYEIAALASMIYDRDIMQYNKERCIELLNTLDYDIMWPV